MPCMPSGGKGGVGNKPSPHVPPSKGMWKRPGTGPTIEEGTGCREGIHGCEFVGNRTAGLKFA